VIISNDFKVISTYFNNMIISLSDFKIISIDFKIRSRIDFKVRSIEIYIYYAMAYHNIWLFDFNIIYRQVRSSRDQIS